MALLILAMSCVSASNASDNLDDLTISDSNSLDLVSTSNSDILSSDSGVSSDDSSNDASGDVLGSDVSSNESNNQSQSTLDSNNQSQSGLDSDNSTLLDSQSNNQSNSESSDSSDSSETVIKNATSISVSSKTVVRGNALNITLKDNASTLLSNKTVTFTFNGKTYNKTTNAKGIASLTLTATPKKYLVKIAFAGDELYEASSKSVNVTLSKTPTSISNSGKSIVRGKLYKLTLKDAKGKALSGKKISISFNGKKYTKTTNSNGQVNLTINVNVGKTYKMTYKFAGDSNYLSSSGSVSIKVKMGTSISGSGSSIVKGKSYTVTLKNANGVVLSNQKIAFTLSGKTYNRTTNAKGQASLKIGLSSGKTYNLTYKYAGNSYYGGSSGKVSLFVKTPTTMKNSGKTIVSGETYKVTLKDADGKSLANKKVSITFNNKTYAKTTNSNGQASLTIKGTFGRSYPLSYKFAGDSKYGPSSGSLSLRVKKATSLKGSASSIVQGKSYTVTLKDSNSTPLANQTIVFTLDTKKYNRTTNAKGQASLKIGLAAGKTYNLAYKYSGTSYYNGSSGSVKLKVKFPTSLTNSGKSVMNGTGYNIVLKDSKSNPVSNKTISIGFNGKTYDEITDANGTVTLLIDANVPKTYKMTYKFAGDSDYGASSGTVNLTVKFKNAFTISQIISASSSLKSYVLKNKKVPATVSVNGVSLNLTSFTYLMAKATISINSNKTSGSILLVPVDSNYTNNGSRINANLYKANYIDLAKKVISSAEANKLVPNSVSTNIGLVSHDLYSFGLAKALVFFNSDHYLPNYLILSSDDVGEKHSTVIPSNARGNASQFKAGLNEAETLTAAQIAKYLVASGHDATNSEIKALAAKLVSGKTSLWDKANAIFTFARDNITYSYYADSRKGAAGTLSSKSGNCCDHSNLIVSLCRAANITARFSHAQGCTFSSGLVAGHVWAQIYIDGVWYTADATSRRNSLGNIVNWNTNHYNTLKQYDHLSF